MKRINLVVSLIFVVSVALGQNIFVAVQDGPWSDPLTWDCGACGESYPDGGDDEVYTEGFAVTLNVNTSVEYILVDYDFSGGLTKSGPARTLTITGQLYSYDADAVLFDPAPNTTTITGNVNLTFTRTSTNISPTDPVIAVWGPLAPIRVNFNGSTASTIINTNGFSVRDGGFVNIQNGIVQLQSGQTIQAASGATSGTLTVSSGATLNLFGSINGDGTTGSFFPSVSNFGTITTSSTSYINATTFTLGDGSGAILNVGFTGANQTQGWWYQGNAPTNLTINAASTVNFNANASQNFFAETYGNLTLSSNSAATKTLVGPGNLVVNGTFSVPSSAVTVASSNTNPRTLQGNLVMAGTWNASQLVSFEGTTAQSISGSGTLAFNGGMEVDKTSGTLTLNKNISVSNGLTITSGTLTLGANTLSISGALVNNGTFNGGSGTLSTSGSTTISGSGTTTPNNITIASGTFTAPSGTLSLTGNFTNNGTFASNNGTINFSGSAQQNVSGSNFSFRNISVNNSALPYGVSFESNQSLLGTLTLAAGTRIDPDGSTDNRVFTLVSSSDSPTTDAMIAPIPATALIDGPITVQRHMSIEGANGGRIYRYISSPVQNAPVSDFQVEIPVTGSFTGTSTCSGCSTNQSMFLYNQATSGLRDLGYEDFPASINSETFSRARGYATFVRGDILGSARWDLTGRVFSGNIPFPVTYNASTPTPLPNDDGWNLVGNPYPSTIDWDAGGWTKSGVDDAIYIYDDATGNVTSYVGGVSTNGGTRYIAMGQGFWVKANSAGPVLSATENVKTAGQQTTFFKEESIHDLIRITMKKGGAKDDAVIRFYTDASDSFDPLYDAYKLKNSTFNLFSYFGDTELAINALRNYSCETNVLLGVEAPAGTYVLEFTEIASFQTGIKIYLHDSYLDKVVSIKENSLYQFDVNQDVASQGKERFFLSFEATPLLNIPVVANDVCSENAQVSLSFTEESTAYQFFMDEQPISEIVEGNGDQLTIEISNELLTEGSNEIRVEATGLCGTYDFDELLIVTKEAVVDVESVEMVNHICQQGSAMLVATGAGVMDTYRWYESEVGGEPIFESSSGNFETEILNKVKTYFVSIGNTLGCEGNRIPVTADVSLYDEVEIAKNGNELVSSYTVGNQWFVNNEPIDGATSQTFQPEESGIYSVEVTIDGCISRAEFDFLITDLEKDFAAEWSYYPNPVTQQLTIKTTYPVNQIKDVSIVNSIGLEVGKITINNDGIGYFDMGASPGGIYVIKILGLGKSVNFKIIKR